MQPFEVISHLARCDHVKKVLEVGKVLVVLCCLGQALVKGQLQRRNHVDVESHDIVVEEDQA